MPAPVATSYEPLTDIEKLNATVDDVLKAGNDRADLTWYIAHTTPLGERKALKGLNERKIAAYLPCETLNEYRRGRKVRIERPLFNAYLFVGLLPHQSIYEVKAVSGIEGIIGAERSPRPITAEKVAAIRQAERNGEFDHAAARKPKYTAGQQVKLMTGFAANCIGQVIETEGEDRIRVLMDYAFARGEIIVTNDQIQAHDEAA